MEKRRRVVKGQKIGRIVGKNKVMGLEDFTVGEACLYLAQKMGKGQSLGRTTFYRYLREEPGKVKVYNSKYNRKKSYYKRLELDGLLAVKPKPETPNRKQPG